MRKQIKQVFHPFDQWEEIKANMWGSVECKKTAFDWAVTFTGNHKLYGHYMNRVINEWPISCENALTDPYLNQKAWLGHAACALANQVPESIIREAWGYLTYEQKFLANQEAERAINVWKERYIKDRVVCQDVGTKMLF